MPFGPDCVWENWQACIAAMKKDGKSDEDAAKICGYWRNRTEKTCAEKQMMQELGLEEEDE